ncbi:MAG: glycerol kinase GlpK [Deltaproteobacteria bacterium]|nr:glycerol kinase GlpK [Deltaproteobacteria bacterium]
MDGILAIDQGTTSSRALIVDRGGKPHSLVQIPVSLSHPHVGWVEQDPMEILRGQIDVAQRALQQSKCRALAVGITNQRETTIVWDRKSGAPVSPAIVWQDRRTAQLCQSLRERGHANLIRERTGLVIDPYFSATKLMWILDSDPELRRRAQAGELCFGTIDSFLVWHLTSGKVHVTDVTNASRTMLFNIHTLEWDSELLALFDIPREMLPTVASSSEVYGEIELEGPLRGIPIAGLCGDQQSALFGQLCLRPGMAKNTYGTGCFLVMTTGSAACASSHGLITTIAWKIGGATTYALEGSVFVAGAAVQWLRDELGVITRAEEVEQLALSVPDSAGVVFVPTFTGFGAPHWDAEARGAIYGLTRGTTRAHIARAALEGVAFQVADVVAAMKQDSGLPLTELRVDGGASANTFLMQFQSDVLGSTLVRPRCLETTAMGAAFLAGLAVKFWNGTDELEQLWQEERRFTPQASQSNIEQQRAAWKDAVRRTRST